MLQIILYLALGVIAGAASGLTGIGRATILLPAFLLISKFNQHTAQGTTLAMMVPPIGLLAALTYYRAGFVDLRVAGLTALGFLFGGLIGAKYAITMPGYVLQKIFGVALLIIALRVIIEKRP